MSNEIEKGALYIVSTPIGNLMDLSPRAQKVLSEVDFIAAEDTRVTMKLLTHFGIKKPMISYFEHNKMFRGDQILERLKSGESAALVSDAGTPAISDPGETLVKLLAENNITVYSIPGPCAAICALTVSGLFTGRFVFEGFLSTNKNERFDRLHEIKDEKRTLIFYEAPHKLKKTLRDMLAVWGERNISLVREITKINEEVIRTTLSSAYKLYREREPKGEFVLVIEGAKEENIKKFWEDMTITEHVEYYIKEQGIEKMEAIKLSARDRDVAKSVIYKEYNGICKEHMIRH